MDKKEHAKGDKTNDINQPEAVSKTTSLSASGTIEDDIIAEHRAELGEESQAQTAAPLIGIADVKPPKQETEPKKKLPKKFYKKELRRLQVELVKLQEWIKYKKMKVVVIFEGRDAAGKGGVIKRITQGLNPRSAKVVALGVPTEREKSQWYFQR